MKTIDVGKIQKEIERKKAQKGVSTIKNKDRFLSDLLESLKTGETGESITRMKTVANEASVKASERFDRTEKKPFSDVSQPVSQSKRTIITEADDDHDREHLIHNKISSIGKSTLADAIESQFNKFTPNRGAERYSETTGNLNEQLLNKKIEESATKFLVENIGDIFTESMRNVLYEHFAEEKIKKVLLENKGAFKSLIIEVIRELQKKKK